MSALRFLNTLGFLLLTAACADDNEGTDGASAGTDAATTTGGAPASAGGTATTAGAPAGTGGAITAGSAPVDTGGTTVTGGARPVTGGTTTPGGAPASTGGATATGGARPVTGGTTTTGGAAADTGGATASGGAGGATYPGVHLTTSPLDLEQTVVALGDSLSVSVTVTNDGSEPVVLQEFLIAGRPPGGTHADGPYLDLSPTLQDLTLAPGQSATLNASRTFGASDPVGTWELFATYQDAEGWHDQESVWVEVVSSSSGTGGVSGAGGANGTGGQVATGGTTSGGGTGNPALDRLLGMEMYSSNPTGAATWIGDWGDMPSVVRDEMDAAAAQGRFVVFSTYYSVDLNPDESGFIAWIEGVASAIGSSPGPTVVALEADAFPSAGDDEAKHRMLDRAIGILKQSAPNAAVFLDIGHSAWLDAQSVVDRARTYQNYALIDGWASNTSNYNPTENEIAYADALYALSGKPTIIDTSRNGCDHPPNIPVHNPPQCTGGQTSNCWCEGQPFQFHDDPAVLFLYYNKPSDEPD